MATVQAQMLKLALKADPVIKSTGVLFAAGTIGTVSGDKFPAQGLLDIYNDARMMFVEALRGDVDWMRKLGSARKTASVTWAALSVSKPSDFISFVDMYTAGNVPMVLRREDLMSVVTSGTNLHYTQSLSNIIIFEVGSTFQQPSGTHNGAATLTYYGIPTYALADVTGGATNDSFDVGLLPHVVEVAAAMANGVGSVDVTQLVKTLTGRK